MIRKLLTLVLLAIFLMCGQTAIPTAALAQTASADTSDKPAFPFPVAPQPQTTQQNAKPKDRVLARNDRVWRLPNGYEEYYMLLAISTQSKKWCDRMSLESQIRKTDARPGVQVVGWRDICLIEVAAATNNPEICRFVRGTVVDGLDGTEFNSKYCVSAVQSGTYTSRLHWLQVNPNKPKFLNSQIVLKYLGFTENDLISQQKQGLYQTVNNSTWDEFLLGKLLDPAMKNRINPDQYQQMVNRSDALPDFSKNSYPADRYLRYTGTSVKLPADCYENPTSEFACRMLECLNVRDIVTCRAMADTKESIDLKNLFIEKCVQKKGQSDSQSYLACKKEIEAPFNKIFLGPPETFLPYLNR